MFNAQEQVYSFFRFISFSQKRIRDFTSFARAADFSSLTAIITGSLELFSKRYVNSFDVHISPTHVAARQYPSMTVLAWNCGDGVPFVRTAAFIAWKGLLYFV